MPGSLSKPLADEAAAGASGGIDLALPLSAIAGAASSRVAPPTPVPADKTSDPGVPKRRATEKDEPVVKAALAYLHAA